MSANLLLGLYPQFSIIQYLLLYNNMRSCYLYNVCGSLFCVWKYVQSDEIMACNKEKKQESFHTALHCTSRIDGGASLRWKNCTYKHKKVMFCICFLSLMYFCMYLMCHLIWYERIKCLCNVCMIGKEAGIFSYSFGLHLTNGWRLNEIIYSCHNWLLIWNKALPYKQTHFKINVDLISDLHVK